jgi:small GTP-binding protein
LKIWDTAGQERYRHIARGFFKLCHGVVLVFDVTDEKSFKDLEIWVTEIKENGHSYEKIMLVGNKIDLVK